jgi:hypothetical protein
MRYPALRFISGLLKVIAVAVLVLCGIVALVGLIILLRGRPQGLLMMIIGPVYGVLIAGVLWAYAELITVAVDVEANTRRTVVLIEQSLRQAAAPAPAPPAAAGSPRPPQSGVESTEPEQPGAAAG